MESRCDRASSRCVAITRRRCRRCRRSVVLYASAGSVTEMRVLLFDFDLGEHDDGGIKILLAEQATALPGRLKIIVAKLGESSHLPWHS